MAQRCKARHVPAGPAIVMLRLTGLYLHMYTRIMEAGLAAVRWVGSSRRDLRIFPQFVRRHIGQALYAAQCGEEYPSVKALKGFVGRSVLGIAAPYHGDTYRAVYTVTVRFQGVIYVLHAFQKKSTKGIATPKREMDLGFVKK